MSLQVSNENQRKNKNNRRNNYYAETRYEDDDFSNFQGPPQYTEVRSAHTSNFQMYSNEMAGKIEYLMDTVEKFKAEQEKLKKLLAENNRQLKERINETLTPIIDQIEKLHTTTQVMPFILLSQISLSNKVNELDSLNQSMISDIANITCRQKEQEKQFRNLLNDNKQQFEYKTGKKFAIIINKIDKLNQNVSELREERQNFINKNSIIVGNLFPNNNFDPNIFTMSVNELLKVAITNEDIEDISKVNEKEGSTTTGSSNGTNKAMVTFICRKIQIQIYEAWIKHRQCINSGFVFSGGERGQGILIWECLTEGQQRSYDECSKLMITNQDYHDCWTKNGITYVTKVNPETSKFVTEVFKIENESDGDDASKKQGSCIIS